MQGTMSLEERRDLVPDADLAGNVVGYDPAEGDFMSMKLELNIRYGSTLAGSEVVARLSSVLEDLGRLGVRSL